MPSPRLRSLRLVLPMLALAALDPSDALAQTWSTTAPVADATVDEASDPPGRVGRLSDLQGPVWHYHPDGGDWVAAERNRPLTSGDRLATDAGGRAEVRIGSVTLRLDAGTELEVLRIDDERMALQLHAGSLTARLRNGETVPEFELLTAEGRFSVQATGRYRFDRAEETSHVTVYAGQALYEGRGSALTVYANQHAEFWIDSTRVAQYRLSDPARDVFAGWNAERDRLDDRAGVPQYVSPEMTGVEDLGRYGQWQQDAEHGALWTPYGVGAGWAPYSVGRWAWVRPWGWTWVDAAPWGFAPFHYGRWVYVRNNWCWAPGGYVRRPVYAPALVAWVGGARLAGGGQPGGQAVGWVPLAPREAYVPSYRVSPRYVRTINGTQVTNVTPLGNVTTLPNGGPREGPRNGPRDGDPRNRHAPHGLTVVPASVLGTRADVGPEARRWRDTPAVRALRDEPTLASALVTAPPAVQPPRVRAPADEPAPRPPVRPRFEPRPEAVTAEQRPGGQRDAAPPPAAPRSVTPPPERDRERDEPRHGGTRGAPPNLRVVPPPGQNPSPSPGLPATTRAAPAPAVPTPRPGAVPVQPQAQPPARPEVVAKPLSVPPPASERSMPADKVLHDEPPRGRAPLR